MAMSLVGVLIVGYLLIQFDLLLTAIVIVIPLIMGYGLYGIYKDRCVF